MFVYVARNKLNGKRYIGITASTLRNRIITHKYSAQRPKTPFHRAIKKYGIDNIEFYVLDDAIDWLALQVKERMWIAFFDSRVPNGYNLTAGGEGTLGYATFTGRHHSLETKVKLAAVHRGMKATAEARAKMSASRLGKPLLHLRGRKHSPEHCRKIALAGIGRTSPNKGKRLNAEWRAKLSASSYVGKTGDNHQRGRHHSPEARKKIGEASRKRWKEGAYKNKRILPFAERVRPEIFDDWRTKIGAAQKLSWQSGNRKKRQLVKIK